MQRARDERIEETERGCEGPQKSQSLRVVGPSNVFFGVARTYYRRHVSEFRM